MRDPKRIPRILTLLFKIWEQQQDLRFNQLVQNLQALYSQQNNNYGKRDFYEKDGEISYQNYYIDLFYLEDDQWEQFLRDYWSEIDEELQEREKQITPEVIEEVVQLFIEAGMNETEITDSLKERIQLFLKKESKWLTIEALLISIKTLSIEERLELFEKIKMKI
ncbi:hypothetical protein [Caldifermentibacillus hisashii]|uniref:hypothetical protein n=1 Tax=Caldifermentibacillus hisashii TaxID=996558 RepID=UPI0034210598